MKIDMNYLGAILAYIVIVVINWIIAEIFNISFELLILMAILINIIIIRARIENNEK